MRTRRRMNRWGDDRGGVAVMAAVFGALICIAAALAVDVGSMVLKGREVQGAADLSALAAAQTLSQPLARTEAAAADTARANLADLASVRLQLGGYTPERRLKPAARFTPGAARPNAARVVLSAPAPLYFGRWIMGRDSVTVSKSATAALPGGQPSAMFSIGSRLASLDGGLANALLSGLLGSHVSLTVMDYRALADARVNLLQFSDALAAELGVTAGDYDALLAHEAQTGQVLKALEAVAGSGAQSALGKLTRLPASATVKLDELIGVETDAREGLRRGLNAEVSAMDLLMATLQTANQERQLALDVGARTGLADLDVMLAIGERPNRAPWLTVTSTGEPIIRTVQTRLYLKATALDKVPLVGLLAQVKVPILIEAASAEARLKAVQCQGEPRVLIEARSGVARVRLGEIDEKRLRDFKSELKVSPAMLVSVLLIAVEGSADIQVADMEWSELRFTGAEIGSAQPKSVKAKGFANGLLTTLLRDTKLTALGIPLHLVTQLLAAVLTPLGPVLDGVVQPLLELLGVRLGEADVWVHGVRCPNQGGVPQLVG
ncbi:TadG family pilus assembly protein [Brevundimonas diminuta]|uniref:TadG family pilus assembly protein n=2 Tax=Pseudomonadota TaxID=1224 RepID=UPI0022AE82BD|nr:TadG family pilus assembly protein [Brevundimonas diminuta]MCZ4107070.1 TadG family pilus assembly protein [Brevundimonas diminuta]